MYDKVAPFPLHNFPTLRSRIIATKIITEFGAVAATPNQTILQDIASLSIPCLLHHLAVRKKIVLQWNRRNIHLITEHLNCLPLEDLQFDHEYAESRKRLEAHEESVLYFGSSAG